ncbi:cilia- and flagella-associated protein 57 [Cloeon dipterum]|uniref:cilia- and flagella-associated protein 57 n=1 Tax=Cloeon dipterum TaxID=197152 RepID=UPI00321FD625
MVAKQNLALQPHFIYGLKPSTTHNVHFASNECIIYPAGGVLVLHSLQDPRSQKYIHLHNKLKPINAICISPKKDVVACAEGGGSPQVSLYSTSNLQYFASLEIPSDSSAQDIACLQFSCDGQLIIVITTEPDWMLFCYNVASKTLDSKTRANMAAQPHVPVKQVACNPSDAATLALVGPDLFRLLQLVDGSWRQFGFYKAQNYPLSSVAWLTSDRILAGTDDGRLLLIESNELRAVFRAYGLQKVSLPSKNENSRNWEESIPRASKEKVTSVVAFKKGFLVGFGEPCQVARFTLEPGQTYLLKTTYSPKPGASRAVWSLAVSPDCSTLACSTEEAQLFQAKLSGASEIEPMHPFGEPLHLGPVVGLSVCVWRSIFVTCGAQDATVRVWNYDTGKQELLRKFDTPPVSVSVHPLGLYTLVLFKECVCLMSIELDDLEMIRTAAAADCIDVQFSPGGDLFAVVYANKVDIVSIVSFVSKLSLSGHCARVESAAWSQDGTKLVTCGADGAIYTWDSATGERLEEMVTKGSHFLGVSTVGRGKTSFLMKGDASVQVIQSNKVERIVKSDIKNLEFTVTTVIRNDRTLLVGSRCGSLIAYALPFNDDGLISAFCCIHSAPITKIVASYDCSIIFTCSEDGSICILKLEDNFANYDEKSIGSVEKVLIGRKNLRDLRDLNNTLSSRLQYQQKEKNDALEYQEMVFTKGTVEMRELKERDEAEMRREMELMKSGHDKELREQMKRFEDFLGQHETTVAKMDNLYQEKLIVQYKKVERLENQLQLQERKYEQLMKDICEKSDLEMRLIQDKQAEISSLLQKQIEELLDERERTKLEHEEVVRSIEFDADKEIIELKTRHETAVRQQVDLLERTQGQLQSAKKKMSGNQEVIMEFEQRIEILQAEIDQLKSTVASLEQFIAEQKKLMERNNIILENKEKDLMSTKRQVEELIKDKANISLHLDLMTRHIEPKEAIIREKTQEIEQLTNELKVERSLRAQLEVEMANLQSQIKQNQKQATLEKTKHRDTLRDIQRIRARVHQLGGVLQQPRRLAEVAAALYSDYGRERDSLEDEHPEEALLELKRQVETLQALNDSLVKKLRIQDEVHRGEKNALKRECISLMKQLNSLQQMRIEQKVPEAGVETQPD